MSEAIEPTEREEIARVLSGIPVFAGRSFGQPAIERIGGLTNRNYRITIGPDSYVLRLAGAGTAAYIDRRAEEHNAKVAAAAGVNAEVLFFEAEAGTMLARYVDGAKTMSESAFKDLARVERAARAFRRMHGFPQRFAGRFDVFAQIDEYLALLRRNQARIPEGYEPCTRRRTPRAARSPRSRRRWHPATTTRSPRTSSTARRGCTWSTGNTPA